MKQHKQKGNLFKCERKKKKNQTKYNSVMLVIINIHTSSKYMGHVSYFVFKWMNKITKEYSKSLIFCFKMFFFFLFHLIFFFVHPFETTVYGARIMLNTEYARFFFFFLENKKQQNKKNPVKESWKIVFFSLLQKDE